MKENYENFSLCYSCINYYSIYEKEFIDSQDQHQFVEKFARDGCIYNITEIQCMKRNVHHTRFISKCTHYSAMNQTVKRKRRGALKFSEKE